MKKIFYLISTGILAFALTTISCDKKTNERAIQENLANSQQTLVSNPETIAAELAQKIRRMDVSWAYWADGTCEVPDKHGSDERSLEDLMRTELKQDTFHSIEYNNLEFNRSFPRMALKLSCGEIKFLDKNDNLRAYALIDDEMIRIYERTTTRNKQERKEIWARHLDGNSLYELYLSHDPYLSKNPSINIFISEKITLYKQVPASNSMLLNRLDDIYGSIYRGIIEEPERALTITRTSELNKIVSDKNLGKNEFLHSFLLSNIPSNPNAEIQIYFEPRLLEPTPKQYIHIFQDVLKKLKK